MKKLIAAIAISVCSLGLFAETNDFYVLHRESNRYCELSHTNVNGSAMLLVTRLGSSNEGAPTYSADYLVRYFSEENLGSEDMIRQIDSVLRFWTVRTKGMFVLREKKISDIYAEWKKAAK